MVISHHLYSAPDGDGGGLEREKCWSCKATTTRAADQELFKPHIHGIFGVTLPEIHNDFQDFYV